jgi:hypothetical protein
MEYGLDQAIHLAALLLYFTESLVGSWETSTISTNLAYVRVCFTVMVGTNRKREVRNYHSR